VIHEVQENMFTAIDYAVRRAAYRTKRMTKSKKREPDDMQRRPAC
jgi:hypothetical protein